MPDQQMPAEEESRAGSEQPRRKRRRRTLACLQCRTRKVKCDFGYPSCTRCLKTPWPEACKYEPRPPSLAARHVDSAETRPELPLSRQETEKGRKENLETPESAAQYFGHDRGPVLATTRLELSETDAISPRNILHGTHPNDHACGYKHDNARGNLNITSFQGNENRTRFHGCSNIGSLFPEVRLLGVLSMIFSVVAQTVY